MFTAKLVTSLKESTAWTEFAAALQDLNEQALEPTLVRLKGMTSVFTMHVDDLQVRFDELGAVFSVGETEAEDIPLLLQQRTDEMHYKGYEYPLLKTFEREFLGVPLSWQPLYAPKDQQAYPYGSKYLLLRDITENELDPADYFKTMRGVIHAELDQVDSNFASLDQFEQLLERVVVPLIPTHIAFSGKQYSLPPMVLTGSKVITNDAILFDDFALDEVPIDINTIEWSIIPLQDSCVPLGGNPIGSTLLGM